MFGRRPTVAPPNELRTWVVVDGNVDRTFDKAVGKTGVEVVGKALRSTASGARVDAFVVWAPAGRQAGFGKKLGAVELEDDRLFGADYRGFLREATDPDVAFQDRAVRGAEHQVAQLDEAARAHRARLTEAYRKLEDIGPEYESRREKPPFPNMFVNSWRPGKGQQVIIGIHDTSTIPGSGLEKMDTNQPWPYVLDALKRNQRVYVAYPGFPRLVLVTGIEAFVNEWTNQKNTVTAGR
jgi:hypothetical protein